MALLPYKSRLSAFGLYLTLLILAGMFHSIGAQQLPPASESKPELAADLRLLKAGFRRSLLTVAIPEIKAHREELLALEKKLAAAQDYAGAVKTRDERTRLEKQLGTLEQEAAILDSRPAVGNAARLAARIELKVSEAKLTGSQIDKKDGAITGWNQPNASATWQLPGIPPGGYEVLVRCTGQAGEVIIKEAFYSLTTTCKPAAEKSAEQNLGVLRIRAGTGTLTLAVAQPEKCSEWRVYSLVLVPPSS